MAALKLFVVFVIGAAHVNGLPPFEGRVVGGRDANEGEFPYQIQLYNGPYFICGGSILNKEFILTAAHCVTGFTPPFSVRVGSTKSGKGKVYAVSDHTVHKSYNDKNGGYDIALLRLKKHIQFDDHVQPINLPTKETPDNVTLTLTGWGLLNYPEKSPDILQTVNVMSFNWNKCKNALIESDFEVIETNICTFAGNGKGACMGDSGGPLAVNNEVVGIVSWGMPCAVGYPDVYTSVFYFIDWIAENMNK